jgi:hypothetical protein
VLSFPPEQVVRLAQQCVIKRTGSRIEISTNCYDVLAGVVGVADTHWFEREDSHGNRFAICRPFIFRIWQRVYREYLLSHDSQRIHVDDYSPDGHGPGCGLIVTININHRREWRVALKADIEQLRDSQDPATQALVSEEKKRRESHVLMHWWHVRPGQPLTPTSEFYPSSWVDGSWVSSDGQGDLKWLPNNQIIAVLCALEPELVRD